MKPYNQYTSPLQNFRATLIPEHLIGCDFIYNVYNLNTNLRVGQLDASDSSFRPTDTQSSLSPNQLRELAGWFDSINKSVAAFV